MSNHVVKILHSPEGYFARCSCRWAMMNPVPWQWEAEDEKRRHLYTVERVKALLRNRSPSVKDQYEWYRKMEADPATPADDRRLWKMLADGLESRLSPPPQQKERLF